MPYMTVLRGLADAARTALAADPYLQSVGIAMAWTPEADGFPAVVTFGRNGDVVDLAEVVPLSRASLLLVQHLLGMLALVGGTAEERIAELNRLLGLADAAGITSKGGDHPQVQHRTLERGAPDDPRPA